MISQESARGLRNHLDVDVLIFANAQDVHAIGVKDALERNGRTAFILSTSAFPHSARISYCPDGHCNIDVPSGRVALNSVKGIWWRRQEEHRPSPDLIHPRLRQFVVRETEHAVVGALLATDCRIMNPLISSRRAAYKPFQLKTARSLGLNIPKTLISNNLAEIRTFCNANGGSFVYKIFNGVPFGMFETRQLHSIDDLDQTVEYSPLIVQQYVEGVVDVRATVVEDFVFAAEIDYRTGRSPVDSRLDQVPIRRHKLPHDVADLLRSFVKMMGLVYSAIDLRLTTSNEYVFFESNPDGQFLFTEIEAELPICDSIARWLSQPSSSRC